MEDDQKHPQSPMNVGEFLALAKQVFEMRPPLGAPLLLIDAVAEAGGAPLVVVMTEQPVPTHLMAEAAGGALCFRVQRRSTLVTVDGKPLVQA